MYNGQNIGALTCFTMSSSTSPERKQYESHCAHHAAKSVPLSTVKSSLRRSLWQKVYVGSAIGLSKYKNGGKRPCDITTLYTLSGVSDRHQGTMSVVRKKVNNVFAPIGGWLHCCLQCDSSFN